MLWNQATGEVKKLEVKPYEQTVRSKNGRWRNITS
jgi:hypothetical protein